MSKVKKIRQKCHKLSIKDTTKGVELTEKNYCVRLLNQLNQWRQNEILCDVTLIVEGIHIPAHKTVLMASSEYFQAMFSMNMQENKASQITLVDHAPNAVKMIVDYIYTGSICVPPADVQDLLITSDMLQLLPVKQMCVDYLTTQLDVHNCLDLWQLSKRFHCTELVAKCTALIEYRYPSVVQTESFLDLPADFVLNLLQRETLTLGFEGETLVIKSLLTWYQHDKDHRLSVTLEGLLMIRWKSVSERIFQELQHHPCLQANPDLWEIMNKARRGSNLEPRHVSSKILVTGGYLQSRTGPICPRLNTTEMLNVDTLEWTHCQPLPVSPSFVHSFVFNGRLLCIVLKYTLGEKQHKSFQDILEYNPVHDGWISFSMRVSDKDSVCDVVYDCIRQRGTTAFDRKLGTLYVVSNACIKSILFDESDGECVTSVTPFPAIPSYQNSNRVDMAAVVCRNELYCLGGSDMDSQSEMYPTSDVITWRENGQQWERRQSMLEPRACLAAVEHEGTIYVIGGFNTFRLRTIERYDERNDCWSRLASMEKPRSHLSSAAVAGKIFVIGGKSYSYKAGGARKVLNLCEMYDIASDEWSSTPHHMTQGRCLAAVAVL